MEYHERKASLRKRFMVFFTFITDYIVYFLTQYNTITNVALFSYDFILYNIIILVLVYNTYTFIWI